MGQHIQSSRSKQDDRTVSIASPTENLAIADIDFDNMASRYKIDGMEIWGLYDHPNFEDLLFTAIGPIDWTDVSATLNDMVSSVKPIQSKSNCQFTSWKNLN